ncbi:hypothetical protein ACYZT3_10315 [Pseudomonas sp. MDT1-16]
MGKFEKRCLIIGAVGSMFGIAWGLYIYFFPGEDGKSRESMNSSQSIANSTLSGRQSQQAISGTGPAIATGSGNVTIINSPSPSFSMPVIRGYYTLCPGFPARGTSPKWGEFLKDVYENMQRVVFVDVQVYLLCDEGASNVENEKTFPRFEMKDGVSYGFGGEFYRMASPSDQKIYDEMLAPGVTNIRIHKDKQGNNSYTNFVTSEGMIDIIYGPFQIKVSEQDSIVDMDLYAPVLDSAMQNEVSRIVKAESVGR